MPVTRGNEGSERDRRCGGTVRVVTTNNTRLKDEARHKGGVEEREGERKVKKKPSGPL